MALKLAASGLATAAGVVPGGSRGPGKRMKGLVRRLRDIGKPGADGAMARTFCFVLDAEDGSAGRASFEAGVAHLHDHERDHDVRDRNADDFSIS